MAISEDVQPVHKEKTATTVVRTIWFTVLVGPFSRSAPFLPVAVFLPLALLLSSHLSSTSPILFFLYFER
jgi:hypothetical protein